LVAWNNINLNCNYFYIILDGWKVWLTDGINILDFALQNKSEFGTTETSDLYKVTEHFSLGQMG